MARQATLPSISQLRDIAGEGSRRYRLVPRKLDREKNKKKNGKVKASAIPSKHQARGFPMTALGHAYRNVKTARSFRSALFGPRRHRQRRIMTEEV